MKKIILILLCAASVHPQTKLSTLSNADLRDAAAKCSAQMQSAWNSFDDADARLEVQEHPYLPTDAASRANVKFQRDKLRADFNSNTAPLVKQADALRMELLARLKMNSARAVSPVRGHPFLEEMHQLNALAERLPK